jgi:hypothetical protein
MKKNTFFLQRLLLFKAHKCMMVFISEKRDGYARCQHQDIKSWIVVCYNSYRNSCIQRPNVKEVFEQIERHLTK